MENNPQDKMNEDIEGLDSPAEIDLGNYPLDSMLIRSATYSVEQICKRIDQGTYIMNPDFQRDFIWTPEQQSKLIESLLMRIPLPVFYLAERKDGKIIVIDGLQRLSSIKYFMDNKYPLRFLKDGNEKFNKKYFKDLDIKLQNRIGDAQLIIYVLDSDLPERAKLDIFERVNSGTPLSRQQMRNSIYNGVATRLLGELSREEDFLCATGKSLNPKSMRDREFINRFFAFFHLGHDQYKGDMDQFLADSLLSINGLEENEIAEIRDSFLSAMKKCYDIWGDHAFRKHKKGQTNRNVINAALFDVLSVEIALFGKDITELCADTLKNLLFTLFENSEFDKAISLSTNSLKHVETRFNMVSAAFKEV